MTINGSYENGLSIHSRSSESGRSGGYGYAGGQPQPARPQIDFGRLAADTQEENYQVMKEEFRKNPSLFLSNQLMMSVQFFRNFDRDREHHRSVKVDTEDEMNEILAATKQRAIVSNTMFHKILDNVGFITKEYNVLVQLLPTEYYITHDCVETNRKEDFERLADGSITYSSLENEPTYRVCVEQAAHQGYSKLRCVDDYNQLIIAAAAERLSLSTHYNDEGSGSAPGSPKTLMPTAGAGPPSPRPPSKLTLNIPNPGENSSNSGNPDTPAEKHTDGILYDRYPTPVIDSSRKLGGRTEERSTGGGGEEEDDEIDEVPLTRDSLFRGIEDRMRYPPSPGVGPPQGMRFRSPVAAHKMQELKEAEEAASQVDGPPAKPPGAGNRLTEPRPSDGSLSSQPNKSNSSHYSLDDDGYGYATSRARMISDLMPSSNFKQPARSGLPANCFKRMEVSPDADIDDDPYPVDEDEKENRVYMSSHNFMDNFARRFYEIAKKINRQALVAGASTRAYRISCHDERQGTEGKWAKESALDFIPTIEVGFWPDEAIEWYLTRQSRKKRRDRRTGIVYQWPPAEIVQQAQKIGFNLVPMGYIEPKKKAARSGPGYSDYSIEWQIHFTKAEELIQKHLNHPKIRCFLFALLLNKIFVGENIISSEHVRHVFYWLVEEFPAGWTDEGLASFLLNIAKKMRGHLTKERLPHYMIYKRNTFDTLPKSKIRTAQERFHRITENLVPHLMVAIRRLQYDARNFYPVPDMIHLHSVLTSANTLLLINPSLAMVAAGPAAAKERQEPRETPDQSQQRMRKIRMKLEQEAEARRRMEEHSKNRRRRKDDVIDLSLVIEPFDETRGSLVIEYFIKHFIAMAKKSNEFRSYGQGLMYQMQAENLMRMLKEFGFYGSAAHVDLANDLEQLRQLDRDSTEDYWHMSWGPEDRGMPSSATGSASTAGGSAGGRGLRPQNSMKAQTEPLPKVPQSNVFIPGTESEPKGNEQVVSVDIHL